MLTFSDVNNIANGWTNYKRYMGESFVFCFGDLKCEHMWIPTRFYFLTVVKYLLGGGSGWRMPQDDRHKSLQQ
jgi:hypothetical protein